MRPPTCLSPIDPHGKRASHGKVTKLLTMVSVMLTCFRGKYIDFQLKLLYGKRVSVFGRGVRPPPLHPLDFGSTPMPNYDSIEIIPTNKTMIFWNQLHRLPRYLPW